VYVSPHCEILCSFITRVQHRKNKLEKKICVCCNWISRSIFFLVSSSGNYEGHDLVTPCSSVEVHRRFWRIVAFVFSSLLVYFLAHFSAWIWEDAFLRNFLYRNIRRCNVEDCGFQKILSRDGVWLQTVFWLQIEFIDHFNTQLVTTINYSTIANLHTLQITRAHSKYFHSVVSSSIFPW
jgi:hypothetical protein